MIDIALLQRSPISRDLIAILTNREDDTAGFRRVRCPLCEWQPNAFSRWTCVDHGHPEYFAGGCGTTWNTFETRGSCPGCEHKWRWTACLQCSGWSPHEDWYLDEPD